MSPLFTFNSHSIDSKTLTSSGFPVNSPFNLIREWQEAIAYTKGESEGNVVTSVTMSVKGQVLSDLVYFVILTQTLMLPHSINTIWFKNLSKSGTVWQPYSPWLLRHGDMSPLSFARICFSHFYIFLFSCNFMDNLKEKTKTKKIW